MSLARGTRFGPFEVLDALGAGGMGEVYRARDTKLHRDVALKILPDVFAADAQRLSRFQREARTLAELNHPSIAHIHGLEEDNGISAIVMELVEGEDLAARLSRGAMPLDEALPIARQIAEALEEAHAHGIIHRDLKPANIKVRDDGTVKLLDFGLAKAFDPADASSAAVANSPTLTAQATALGVLLGTAAYMAPEQAKGKPVDKRVDIWAFGVVLYEMLTGRRAFDGHDVTDVLAAVIKDTPSLDALPAATPPSIRRLLRRCLEKDRRERLGDMSAVRLEIRDALAGESVDGAKPAVASRFGQRLAWVAALLTMAALGGLVAVLYFRPAAELPEMRVEINTRSSPGASFALSPDGRRLVFAAADDSARQLWLQVLDTATVQPLQGTDGATSPFWSPDSRSIAFFAGSKLMRLDLGRGLPRQLATVVRGNGGSWSRNGMILFARTGIDHLWKVSSQSGGEAMPATKVDLSHQAHVFPHFLPDGERFLFYTKGTFNDQGIYLGSLGSLATTRLTAADTAGAYLPPGWLLFVRNGTLVAQGFDASRGEVRGEPQTVADPVGFNASVGVGAFSTAATGAVRPVFVRMAAAATAVWILALGTLSWHQVQIWRDTETLWNFAGEAEPDCSICQVNLGTALFRRGLLDQAKVRYELALTLRPDRFQVHGNLGVVLHRLGKHEGAMSHLGIALSGQPNNASILANIAGVLLDQKSYGEAMRYYERAIRVDPNSLPALVNLGDALIKTGRPAAAVPYLLRARDIRPDEPVIYLNLTRAYLGSSQYASGRKAYETLIALDAQLAKQIEPRAFRAGL
jgi:Tfp pilus assembly protein PilF/tRNA A-37 threonylcarbamoyl transferase component Bud32